MGRDDYREERVKNAVKKHGKNTLAWRDEYGITYIIFTIEEIMNLMNLGNKKVNKMLKELEEHGLIYRRH